jgi:predicted nucleic acid-binding protein
VTPRAVCLDSSVVAKWAFAEAQQADALILFDAYWEGELVLVAPDHFTVERINIVIKKLRREAVPSVLCDDALQELFALRVRLVAVSPLHRRVFEIAEAANETAWDAAYIAVAEAEGCEFWTADRELARRAKPHFPFVKLLGEDRFEEAPAP